MSAGLSRKRGEGHAAVTLRGEIGSSAYLNLARKIADIPVQEVCLHFFSLLRVFLQSGVCVHRFRAPSYTFSCYL